MVSQRRLIGGRKSIPHPDPSSHNIRQSSPDNGHQPRSYTSRPSLEDDLGPESDRRVDQEDSQHDVTMEEEENVDPPNTLEVAPISDDAGPKTKLLPLGDTFENKAEVLKIIHDIIHAHFKGPWPCFSKVPPWAITLWWNEFENHYFWDKWDGPLIKANWRAKCSAHIRNTFADCRKRLVKPKWVSPKHWATLMKHWKEDTKFKHCSQVNKKNRAAEGPDGIAIYTGGSKSVAEHNLEFKIANGRDMTTQELMEATYHSKRHGKWMSERLKKCLDRYNALYALFLESHLEITKQDEEMLWAQAVGGEKKGRIYGKGSMYRKWDYVFNDQQPPESSPTPPSAAPLARDPAPQLCIAPLPALDPAPQLRVAPLPARDSAPQLFVAPLPARDLALQLRVAPLPARDPALQLRVAPLPARDPFASGVTPNMIDNVNQTQMELLMARFEAQERMNQALSQELRNYKDKANMMSLPTQTLPPELSLQALLGSDLSPLMNPQSGGTSFSNYGAASRTSDVEQDDDLGPY